MPNGSHPISIHFSFLRSVKFGHNLMALTKVWFESLFLDLRVDLVIVGSLFSWSQAVTKHKLFVAHCSTHSSYVCLQTSCLCVQAPNTVIILL
jgi:hypothetical protein